MSFESPNSESTWKIKWKYACFEQISHLEGGKKVRESQQKSVCGERERERWGMEEITTGSLFLFP